MSVKGASDYVEEQFITNARDSDVTTSPEFLMVIALDTRCRNSARERAQQVFDGDGERHPFSGGDYYEALRAGDIFGAFCHADGTNTKILCRLFEQQYIIECAVRDGNPLDYAARLIGEKYARHATEGEL